MTDTITLDDIKYSEKEVSNVAKKLMTTLQLHTSESIKLHLEKAYQIGYMDAIAKVKKIINIDLSKY
jgi:hypothetical protein